MSEMTLLLFRPLLLPPKNLIVSEDSAKWTRRKRDEWGFVHRCENADGMGACDRAAVIEIYLKISNERCECGVGLGGGERRVLRIGGGAGRWEKDVDFREVARALRWGFPVWWCNCQG